VEGYLSPATADNFDEKIHALAEHQKSQTAENDQSHDRDVCPNISPERFQAVAKNRETSVTEGRDGMKQRIK